MKHNTCTRTLMSALILLAVSASARAADLDSVRVVFDPDVSSRTNMGRQVGETSELRVTFDPGVMARTNVHRSAEDATPVRISRDDAFMKRTNMGGSALQRRALPDPSQSTARVH